ncbi:MAG TPA: hypothetical protein VKV41_10155 [Methylomirabilota bacterium]|nr:hypothetical protein [Methylomirabilota bacterium]
MSDRERTARRKEARDLSNEVTAVQIRGRRMAAAVALIQALGGGWSAGELPSTKEVTQRERPAAPPP